MLTCFSLPNSGTASVLLYLHKNYFSVSLDGCLIPVWIDHAAEVHRLALPEPFWVRKPSSSVTGLG